MRARPWPLVVWPLRRGPLEAVERPRSGDPINPQMTGPLEMHHRPFGERAVPAVGRARPVAHRGQLVLQPAYRR